MKKQKKAILIIIGIILLVCSSAGVVYAWFLGNGAQSDRTHMGVVDIAVDAKEYKLSTGLTYNTSQNVVLTSNSKIDYYLRTGYTFIYKDGSGNDLPVNVPDDLVTLKVSKVRVNDTTDRALSPQSIISYPTVGGYKKRYVEFLDAPGVIPAAQANKLMVMPSGEGNTLKFRMDFVYNKTKYPDYFNAKAPGNLYMVLTPETIQATKLAVTAANPYGWDPAKVYSQDDTVVPDNI